MNRELGLVKFI